MATQTLTFLFADIEGSTAMSRRLGDAHAGVLADYHRLRRAGLAARGGEDVVTRGGECSTVFASPQACADAAIEMRRALAWPARPAGEPVRARMGIDSGEESGTAAGLARPAVGRAARVAAVAHGGQVLVSAAAGGLRAGSLAAGVWLTDLGRHRLTDRGRAEQIFQVEAGAAGGLGAAAVARGARQC